MKGEIIYKILNSLGDGMLDYVDFTNAFMKAGYGATGNKINYEFSKIQNRRISLEINRQKINNLKKYLQKLKSEGLILESNSKQIYLSNKGKNKLNNFQNSFSLNKNLYQPKTGDRVIIISYDIPVAFNKERNILLNSPLSFTYVQHRGTVLVQVFCKKYGFMLSYFNLNEKYT